MHTRLFVLIFLSLAALSQDFTDPVILNSNAATDEADDTQPRLATDGFGNWMVVWFHNDDEDGLGLDFDILFMVSTDDGETWSAPAPVNNDALTNGTNDEDEWPHLIATGENSWLVVWDSSTDRGGIGTDKDIFYATTTNNGTSWTTPGTLNTNAGTDGTQGDFEPEVATDGAGTIVVVWQAHLDTATYGTDLELAFSRSTNGGTTWSAPAPLNSLADTDSSLSHDVEQKIATDGAGNWIVVWRYNVGLNTPQLIYFSRSTDNGATWSNMAPIGDTADYTGQGNVPYIHTDGAGNWVCVYNSGSDINNGFVTELTYSHSSDNGASWSEPAHFINGGVPNGYTDAVPVLSSNGAGDWLVAWVATRDAGHPAGEDGDIFRASSTDGGATWGAEEPLNNDALTDHTRAYDSLTVTMASDGSKHMAVWTYQNGFGTDAGADAELKMAMTVACVLPASFLKGADNWGPDMTVLDLVGIVNTACPAE